MLGIDKKITEIKSYLFKYRVWALQNESMKTEDKEKKMRNKKHQKKWTACLFSKNTPTPPQQKSEPPVHFIVFFFWETFP